MTDSTTTALPATPESTTPLLVRLGGRKFFLVEQLIAAALLAALFHLKVDKDLLDFVKWLVGLYMAGNVGRAAADKLLPKAAP